MQHLATLLLAIGLLLLPADGQAQSIDSIRFFLDEPAIEMTLTTDIKALQSQKGNDMFQPGTISMRIPDTVQVNEQEVKVAARGNFRRGYCRIPPIMIDFRDPASRMNRMGKLKLVMGCGQREDDEQLLLKEFLIYKIYNLLEEKSFRVRLAKTTYVDTRSRVKTYTQYAFLIEDDADMARRNGCRKKENHPPFSSESVDRETMTKVALFEYMIGNTDWSVPNEHNIKLVFPKKPENALPFTVPYDFDYCGLVDASYAVPNEVIGTEKVTERVYRGFPRSIEELQVALDQFREKKAAIYALINGFTTISERHRKTMISYLDEFYKTINDKSDVQRIFIDNARTN